MRKFLTLISAAAILATPAFAQARGFDSNFSQTVTGPFKLEVVVSEDLAHRANNLPEKLSDRGSSSRLNTVIGTAEYNYFSSFNDRPNISSSGVWMDADRAFSRFSKKLSKKLAKMTPGAS